MTKLDERIRIDLAERFYGNPISAATELAPLAKDGDGFRFSTKGMPTYFTGKRDAQTVFVQLNPGMDAEKADAKWTEYTKEFNTSNPEAFIADYKTRQTNFGQLDRLRYDSFDVKQAAFLYEWKDSGINFPKNINWSSREEKINAKELVLMQKLQLELIPFASQKFELNKSQLDLLVPYVETLLDEIFCKKEGRKYVIFGGDFDSVFKKYNETHPSSIVDLTGKIPVKGLKKNDGTDIKRPLYYKVIDIHYHNEQRQKALIAYTFPQTNLANAYAILQEYGRQCYEAFVNTPFIRNKK